MPTDAAFLAAVAASPADSLPRLVYADWLDEQGDPRGEMVRVMEEMRKHPVWADAYQQLRPARNRLWASLDAGWLDAMGYQKVYRPLFGKLPNDRAHRWRLAEEFIDIWHGGLKEGDGYINEMIDLAAERFRIPTALREWYRLAGKREDIWARRGRLLTPRDLHLQSGNLVFREQLDWHVKGSDLRQADPPVYRQTNSELVADAVSTCALLMLVSAVRPQHVGCGIHIGRGERFRLPSRFERAELPGRNLHLFDIEYWESADTVAQLNRTSYCVFACRTESAYRQVVAEFGERVVRDRR